MLATLLLFVLTECCVKIRLCSIFLKSGFNFSMVKLNHQNFKHIFNILYHNLKFSFCVVFNMENYKKGKNVEDSWDRNKIPIPNLPTNFLWMQVRGGSKIRYLLTHAFNEFQETKSVVWTGFGQSVGKAVTCAELMKKEYKNKLHQVTKLSYRLVEEFWDPLLPELDQIVVKRKLPMIHIYLSFDPIDIEELGYQLPGSSIPYKTKDSRNKKKINKKEFSNMQVQGKKNINKPNGKLSNKN